ncbi:MAG TPA: dihydrolipoamide acetyltransferase family protein, partial [Caulobacteraceae bacterium]
MAEHVVKLPDVGEGVAEAELVEWHVKVGDLVREDDLLADVMTDKATVEIPSPVAGEVTWVGGEVGDTVAIGSALVRLKVGGEGAAVASEPKKKAQAEPKPSPPPPPEPVAAAPVSPPAPKREPGAVRSSQPRPIFGAKPIASPAVRLAAREAGVDLRQVGGSGPGGRITREDLQAFISQGTAGAVLAPGLVQRTEITEVKVVGLRRRIAEKMALAKARIPHITIVEEVNVTPLEDLRAVLNRRARPDQAKLTLLPFLMRAMVKAVAEQPGLNALFDDDAGIIRQHAGVHIGIATQTPAGLVVPVVKHAEARDIWNSAAELARLAERARDGTATREELS